jgi:hypothetical protein
MGKPARRRQNIFRDDAKPLEWIVPGWVYAKSVALLVGKRGGGKSQLVAWWAGQLSNGRYIDADGTESTLTRPIKVWINVVNEDSIEEFWYPRLDLAGANPKHVRVTANNYLLPTDLGELREDLHGLQKDGFSPDLIVLDSMSTHFRNPYFGFRYNKMAIGGLVALAQKNTLSVLITHHFRKGKGSTVESAVGGQGILQAGAKAIHVIGQYPNETATTRVLACERINAKMPRSLLFEQQTKYVKAVRSEHSYLLYSGPITATSEDVYAASREKVRGSIKTGAEEVAEWIKSLPELVDERPMKIADLEARAQAAGRYFSKGPRPWPTASETRVRSNIRTGQRVGQRDCPSTCLTVYVVDQCSTAGFRTQAGARGSWLRRRRTNTGNSFPKSLVLDLRRVDRCT